MKIKNSFFEMLATGDNKEAFSLDFTAKTSFYLTRIFKLIEAESRTYFEQKEKLIDKYALKKDGKIVSDGNTVTLENPQKFQEEYNELLNCEVDIGAEKVKIDFDKEPNLSMKKMDIIFDFIEEK